MQRHKEIKYISNTCLYNYSQLIVENGKDSILYTIDMRELEEYKAKHFKEAIHKTNEKKLQKIKNETITTRKIIIVFYTRGETKKIVKRNIKETLKTEKEKKKEEETEREREREKKEYNVKQCDAIIEKYFTNINAQFFVLKDGFFSFEKEYPFLCLSEEQEKLGGKKETLPQLIASINYPLRILENVYLGNFIHINNIHIYRFLKIKHVYDFTGSGFLNKMQKHIHYHRYDVFKKKFENRNFSEKEPLTYSNFLSVQFIHNIICHIAKHDQMYQKGARERKGKTEVETEVETETETVTETKTDAESKTEREQETEKEKEKEREKEQTDYKDETNVEKKGAGREIILGHQFKDANRETNDKVHKENEKHTKNRNVRCEQEQTQEQTQEQKEKMTHYYKIKKENDCDPQMHSENEKSIFPKNIVGAEKDEEIMKPEKQGPTQKQQKEETRREEKKIEEKDICNTKDNDGESENYKEKEKKEDAKNKKKRNLKTEKQTHTETKAQTETKKIKDCNEPLGENENEENEKEQDKIDAILILCNDGIKNQTKTKINSISLITCMCYTMFRNRCNENFAIARFLKICNDLEINSYTFTVLKSFYHHLQSINFCLEQIKPDESEQLGEANGAEERGTRKEKQSPEKKDQKKQNKDKQRKIKPHKIGTYCEDSGQSASSDSDDSSKSSRENEEHQKHLEIRKGTMTYGKNKNSVLDESEMTEITESDEHMDDKTHKTRKSNRSKRNRSRSIKNVGHTLQNTLLEIRRNDMCKGILNSFKIKKKYVIFEENKNNIIYIKYDAPGNNTEKTKRDYSLKLMNKNIVIYNIVNEVYYDYEHMLASILYNIYNCTLVETEDVETCIRVLYEATNFEKHRIFVTMPYISLILFNLCVLKTNNEIELLDPLNNKKDIEKQSILDKHIVYLLYSYTKDSILYILYNVQIPTGMSEIKITFQMTKEQLRQTPLTEEHYSVLAALKYFLITFLYFYVNQYIETLNCTRLEKFNNKLLKHINTFADCYYAKFTVNIHKFLKPNYIPEVDPYDNLPYYFSDILRPFILLHNYFVE